MQYDIILAPEAADDLKSLKANVRTAVREAVEQHLRQETGFEAYRHLWDVVRRLDCRSGLRS